MAGRDSIGLLRCPLVEMSFLGTTTSKFTETKIAGNGWDKFLMWTFDRSVIMNKATTHLTSWLPDSYILPTGGMEP